MKPSVNAAYLFLIAVWSTTALGIKWGVQGLPFTLALASRFVLAAVLMLGWLAWRRQSLPLAAPYRRAYWIAGLATACSMCCSFWAAQAVSSGLIAIIFGLSPLATAIFASRWLGSQLDRREWLAIALGLAGLLIIFARQLHWQADGGWRLLALCVAMALQSGAAVLLKRFASGLSPWLVNAGALQIAALATLLFWCLAGAPWVSHWPWRTAVALIYLAAVGSVLGFSLYYWLIRECRPMSVALIALITPASSLWLGHALNAEILQSHELIGTACIMLGLAVHVWASRREMPTNQPS
ncbi:DMT family transporter [Chitinibacter sp. ZOR0017]|uniref:DMT family transporter n=1 Tax=Chitinibacter sp. ZOR0017 TaxID=1339254 RepID=UPI00068A6453|nr:EamA family transporter [Chitinibacter sp. ZOR0017]